jgi:hypothetical protein
LADDAWLTMPPVPLEYRGLALAETFLRAMIFRDGRTCRLVPTRARLCPSCTDNVRRGRGAADRSLAASRTRAPHQGSKPHPLWTSSGGVRGIEQGAHAGG